jgi:hypothetical protein
MSNQQSRPDILNESKEKGYEVRDANIPHVLIYGFGMLLLVILAGVVISVVVYKYMGWFLHREPPPPQYQARQGELPPAPRLEVQGQRDLNDFRAAEQKQLESYGWVNKDRGIVRIPIARAMEITAQRGLPSTTPGMFGPTGKVAPAQRSGAGTASPSGVPGQRDNPAKTGQRGVLVPGRRNK